MNEWLPMLACPTCGSALRSDTKALQCETCHRDYPQTEERVYFLGRSGPSAVEANPDAASMIKGYRKPNPLVRAARRWITSEYFPGRAWREARKTTLAGEGLCLVLGSGVTRYPRAVHLDLDDYPGVDVIADAHRLPFADASMTGVLSEVVLEHVAHPERVVAEAWRVLRPGGRCFFIVPFIFPFHGQPNDYKRWSREGLRADFAAFDQLEIGIHGGPCSAMVHLLSEWCYVATGLRFPRAYVPIKGLSTALLMPLKFADFFVNRFPEAHRLAATLYVTGVKPSVT